MIRSFKKPDFPACVEIVEAVWGFDIRFSPQKYAKLLREYYTSTSLNTSSYCRVIEGNGKIQGFIFGKVGDRHLLLSYIREIRDQLIFLVQLFLMSKVSFSRKLRLLQSAMVHDTNRGEIEPSKRNEVVLFAVHPSAQGKGYGRILIQSFIQHCKENGVKRITLETDKECNYRFYEHLGFKVKGEFYSPLQKEYSGKSGESFVYEWLVDHPGSYEKEI